MQYTGWRLRLWYMTVGGFRAAEGTAMVLSVGFYQPQWEMFLHVSHINWKRTQTAKERE